MSASEVQHYRDIPINQDFDDERFGFHSNIEDIEKLFDEHEAEFLRRPSSFDRFKNFSFGHHPPTRRNFRFHHESDDEDLPEARPQPAPKQQAPPSSPKSDQPSTSARRTGVQQSNTVDLGQKLHEVDEQEREQRSMSAPPTETRPASTKRFVSSINIPMKAAGASQQEAGSHEEPPLVQPTTKPVERVIPIFVEGRDEPIIPRNTSGPTAQSTPQPMPQPMPQPAAQPAPPTERIFGQRPEQFTQFVHKKESTPPPAKPAPVVTTPIDLIQAIQKDVSQLMGQVEKFSGQPKDKEYLYLDEMLTRNLIKLDNIDTQSQENIRTARKEAIKCIQKCIGILEAKAAVNAQQGQVQGADPPKEEPMETVPEEEVVVAPPSNEQSGAEGAQSN